MLIKKIDFYKSLNFSNKNILHELNLVISDYYSFIGEVNNPNNIESKDIHNLTRACIFWYYLRQDELDGFRSKTHDKVFLKFLFNSIINNVPLNYISILCPSYKKGIDVYGFVEEPGNTTYRNFANIYTFKKNTDKLGIPSTINIYFADISIERWNKIVCDINELQRFQNIIKLDRIISNVYGFEYDVLSSLGNLINIVGYEGKLIKNPKVDKKALERAKWKDRQFYSKIFGWSEEECDIRTQIHAHSYSNQSIALRKKNSQPIVFYSGYDYEKGALYNGINGKDDIAVIYPRKSVNNEKSSTIREWDINL